MENRTENFAKVDDLLARTKVGDTAAMNEIWEIMQPEFRSIARAKMQGEGHTTNLGRTGDGLVNELWLKLEPTMPTITTARQLLAVGRVAMKNILVDCARVNRAQMRDAAKRTSIEEALYEVGLTDDGGMEDLWRAVEALRALALDPDPAEAIDLCFVDGMTHAEVGEALGVSRQKAQRLLQFGISWLRERLTATASTARV